VLDTTLTSFNLLVLGPIIDDADRVRELIPSLDLPVRIHARRSSRGASTPPSTRPPANLLIAGRKRLHIVRLELDDLFDLGAVLSSLPVELFASPPLEGSEFGALGSTGPEISLKGAIVA
jgi:hypothetical protein